MSQLQEYLAQVEAVKADAQAFVPALTETQFNWRPAPDRWSVGQCIDHLNVGVRVTFPAFDRAIDEARAKGLVGQGPFTYGLFSRWMVAAMEPPVKRRMRTFKILMPADAPTVLHPKEALAEFLVVRDGLAERLRRADGLDWRRARITSPVNRFFRLSLGAYFAFILAHDRRHLWQAHQVMAAPGFGT